MSGMNLAFPYPGAEKLLKQARETSYIKKGKWYA